MRKPKQNQTLFEELDDLEETWETYNKQMKPQPHLRRYSSEGLYDSIKSSFTNNLLENSPRSLMSSLQENRRKSPILEDGSYWKVRTNDLAAQEILSERRAALVSGKLKGRRLFEGLENGDEICSNCFDLLQESHEVRSVGSYGSHDEKKVEDFGSWGEKSEGILGLDDSFLWDEKMAEKEKREVDVKEQKRFVVGSKPGGNGGGGRWMLAMASFAVVTIALTFGLISMSCNGGNLHEDKVILFPT